MIFIRFKQTITRNKHTGKKLYDGNEIPQLPSKWNKITKSTIKPKKKNNYLIIPQDDLLVIDIDDPKLTKKMLKKANSGWYIVTSDNKTAHFYFKPTKYYRDAFKKTERFKIGNKIDMLQGTSLVFTPNKYNKTKSVLQGSLKNIPPIPKKVVKWLKKLYEKENKYTISNSENAIVFPYLLKHDIEYAFKMDKKAKNWKHYWYPLFKLITPSSYRHLVEPDYHPNRIPDGQGIQYLQALSAKLAGDLSVDEKLHRKLIKFIAQKLWQDPLSDEKLSSFLSNLITQTYPDGTRVFQYNPQIMEQKFLIRPLESEEKAFFSPVYRDIDGNYFYLNNNKLIKAKSATLFSDYIKSRNFEARAGNVIVKDFSLKKYGNYIDTVEVIDDITKPRGYFKEKTVFYFNIFTSTEHLKRLRDKERIKIVTQCPKFFEEILDNVLYDNKDKKKLKDLFLRFIARKFITYDYTPLIFQLIGGEGTGKNRLLDVLSKIHKTAELNMNTNFNGLLANSLIVTSHEADLASDKTTNLVKKFSGSNEIVIEKKFENPYTLPNVATLFLTSNHENTLAENKKARRIVSFLSFEAPPLRIITDAEIEANLNDLVDYLIYLHLSNPISDDDYLKSSNWLDVKMQELVATKIELEEDINNSPESNLKHLLNSYNDLQPKEIYKRLIESLGDNFKFYVTKDNKVSIPIFEGMINKIRLKQKLDKTKLTQGTAKLRLRRTKLHKVNTYTIDLPQQMVVMIQKYLKKRNAINKKTITIDYKVVQ